MHVPRRKFLQTFFVGFAITSTKGWANKAPRQATERRDLFPQGVASGDPTPNSVILWTRRPPAKESAARKLVVEISTTPDFKSILAGGTTQKAPMQTGPAASWLLTSNPTGSTGTALLMSMDLPAVSVVPSQQQQRIRKNPYALRLFVASALTRLP